LARGRLFVPLRRLRCAPASAARRPRGAASLGSASRRASLRSP